MGFQEVFPEILEKTYSNCHTLKENPFMSSILLNSRLFGDKIICLPFLDTIKVNLKKIKEDLDKIVGAYENKKIEVRLSEFDPNFKKLKKIFTKNGFSENIVKGHIISNLTSEEEIWKNFHKHTRNDIRKSEKGGLTIKKMDSIEELKRFYGLYLSQMKKFGTPQHSFNFFKNCFGLMKENFYGLNCYLKNNLVGSIILFIEGDYGYVSFNVSETKYLNLRVNDLLYWNVIKGCIGRKIKYFDIGQVDLEVKENTREESLLKFKKKWLGEVYNKVYFTKNFTYDSAKKDSLKKFRAIWRKLPLVLIRIIGPKICSQLG